MYSHAVPDKCQLMELWQNLHRQNLHILEYLREALLLSLLLGAGVGAVDTLKDQGWAGPSGVQRCEEHPRDIGS